MNRISGLAKQLREKGIHVSVHYADETRNVPGGCEGWYYVLVAKNPETHRFSSETSVETFLFSLIVKAQEAETLTRCAGIVESLAGLGVPVEFFRGSDGYLAVIHEDFSVTVQTAVDLYVLLCALLKVALK